MSADAVAPGGIDAPLRRTLIVVGLGLFLAFLEVAVVNVALDTLVEDLDASIASVQWVVTGYLLAIAAVVPLTGWLARRLGPRNLYLAALALFTLASALCAVSWSIGSLIAFRVLQGMGGGALQPVAQTIATRQAGPHRARAAMGVLGSIGILAPILGPVTGGVIVDQLDWRWIFWINIPLGIAGLLLALRLLAPDEAEKAGPLDWVGLATLGLGLPLVTYSLTELGQGGDVGAISGLPLMLVGAALIAFFIVHARLVEHPLLDLRLYAARSFALAAATIGIAGAALFGPYLLMPLFLQQVHGYTAIEAGLLFGSQGVGAAIGIRLGNRLHDRFRPGQLAFTGSVIMLVFTIPLALFDEGTSTALYAVDLALRGGGAGLVMIPAFGIALSDISRRQMADANAQITVLLRIGAAVGTAVLATLLAHQLGRHAATAAGMADAFGTTWAWTLVIQVLALIPTYLLLRMPARPPAAS